MKSLVILPLMIPLVSAAIGMMAWRSPRAQRIIGVAGTALLMAASLALLALVWQEGIQVVQFGGWPAPFGISFVADMFSAMMVVLAAAMGLAAAIYSLADIDLRRQKFGYYSLFNVLLMGVCGAFLTGDLFNLYVWYEVMLMASFVLMALGSERPQIEGALKYVTINLVASAIFLAAVGSLYATAQTLNMADLAQRLPDIAKEHPYILAAQGMLFLVAFGIKAGIFPLFFWLPASYHTPPAAISAVFAGLLTKVGVYSLIRFFATILPTTMPEFNYILGIVLGLSALTMVFGVFGAVSQFEIRKILGFHIISQVGYMTAGLGLLLVDNHEVRLLAMTAAVFYIAHHIVVKTNLFFIGGVVAALRGTYDLKPLGGMAKSAPWLAALFLIPAMSLAGIPPLSGFWAKFTIVKASLMADAYWVAAAALFAGLFTLLSMMKIWNEVFWKAPSEHDGKLDAPPRRLPAWKLWSLMTPVVLLAAITVWIGLYPQTLLAFSQRAAEQIIHPEQYIQAVRPLTPEEAIRELQAQSHSGTAHDEDSP